MRNPRCPATVWGDECRKWPLSGRSSGREGAARGCSPSQETCLIEKPTRSGGGRRAGPHFHAVPSQPRSPGNRSRLWVMRRRDAIDHHLLCPQRRVGWPALVCTGLSVSLHALLLAAATFAVLSGTAPTELIRVSLLTGGTAGPAPAPAEPAAAPPVASQEPPRQAAQQRLHRSQPRIAAVARRARVETPERAAPATGEPASVVPAAGVGGGAEATGGSGGIGLGNGGGSGIGDGIDQRAACVYCPEPRYPFIARARGWQGSVDVGLLVLADGTVDSASLRRSSGYGALDEAAIAVARRSRFSPPAIHGLPTPLRGRIEYRFELSNAH